MNNTEEDNLSIEQSILKNQELMLTSGINFVNFKNKNKSLKLRKIYN